MPHSVTEIDKVAQTGFFLVDRHNVCLHTDTASDHIEKKRLRFRAGFEGLALICGRARRKGSEHG